MSNEQDELTRLRERVATLEAWIAKMPRTADGVPVTLGMKVYEPWVRGVLEHEVHPDGFAYSRRQDGDWNREDIAECYSTPEAALASGKVLA